MPHSFKRRPSQLALSMPARDREMDNSFFHLDSSFGDYLDMDSEPYMRSDPEAESVRSHPSSHLDADQTLLPHSPAAIPARSQTQRLQRRRNQYYYSNGLLVPVPATMSPQQSPSPDQRHIVATQSSSQHKRAKSYSTSGTASSWLLGSSSAFAEVKRQSWTGERREIRKLQKDHPVGSARPSATVEIGDDSGFSTGGADTAAAEGNSAKGSVLGVRRKMEKLRGLYRRGEKEVMVSSNLR